MKLDLNEIYHIPGAEMPADAGTKPEKVTVDTFSPNSSWFLGKPWMYLPVASAVSYKIIKKMEELSLPEDNKDDFKKGVIFDRSLGTSMTEPQFVALSQADKKATSEFLSASNYVYPPLKRGHNSLVRITAYVLLAARKF